MAAVPAPALDLATFAGKPPGSGANFQKLSARLAARGAKNPDRLAAWIGRRKYGAKKFGKLSAHSHSNTGSAIQLAFHPDELRGKDGRWSDTGGGRGIPNDHPSAQRMTVAELRSHMANEHSGGPVPESLRGTSRSARGKAQLVAQHEKMHQLIATGGSAGNQLADPGVGHSHGQASNYANTGPAMEFAMPSVRRLPVQSPSDLIVSRTPQGTAIIRHRNGGMEIATLRNSERGWIAAMDGKDLAPHTHQRGALSEAIGTWNRGAGTAQHRPAAAGEPLQPAPRQTPLMQAYGIPAIRALATPTVGASDGPRTTSSDSSDDDSDGPSGLSPKGMQIYKKLKARGFPDARAMAFAKRAQTFGGGGSS